MKELHTGAVLADMLRRQGVKHVFGVPGVQTMPLYEGIYDSHGDVVHVCMRDERGAAFAAEAYAKISRRPGVCDATVGPGATNLTSGVGEAYNGSVPMVVLISGIPVSWAVREEFGNASQAFCQLPMFSTISKWRARVEIPETLPGLVREAFRMATSGRPGPAVLELPQDVLEAEFTPEISETWTDARFSYYPAVPTMPDMKSVARAAVLLTESKKPVIVAGGGIHLSGAYDELVALAHAVPAPVVTTVTGKGSIFEDHPLAAGVVGLTGHVTANRLLSEADMVLFAGCKAGQFATSNYTIPAPGTTVVHLDIDAGEIGRNYPVDVAMVGDARLGLLALASRLNFDINSTEWRSSDSARRASEANREWERVSDERSKSQDSPVKPQRLMREIDSVTGPDDILVSDAGFVAGWSATYWKAKQSGRNFITDRGLAGLGYGLPAAIGAHYAAPEKRITCLTGDGAFGYYVGELETVRRLGIPLLLVVLNNSCFGWIKWVQKLYYDEKYISVDLEDVDFAKVAEGFGWHGYSIDRTSDIAPVLKEARGLGEPALLDVRIDNEETPVIPYQKDVGDHPSFG